MMKLEDALVDHDDRPQYPPKVISAEVLMNPFPDIVPRVVPKQKVCPPIIPQMGDILHRISFCALLV